MTLLELSEDYSAHAKTLRARIALLEALEPSEDMGEQLLLRQRIGLLRTMWREARELALLTEHYYERGYWRNVKYTL